MPLQISDRVRALGAQAQDALSEQFARIDAIAEYNTQKVLSAFQTHKVAESMFQGTTGYGYDVLGRETLGAIYADLFGAEDAMVRINFVNGTHAISSALYGVLRPGDVLGALTGDMGFDGADIGKINVHPAHVYVAIRQNMAQKAYKQLQNGKIKGKACRVRLLK